MRRSLLTLSLPMFAVLGCLTPASRPGGTSATGGQSAASGGSGGVAGSGGSSGSGGVTSSGGSSGSGGVTSSGGSSVEGVGGSSGVGGTTRPGDDAADQPPGSGGGTAGTGGGGTSRGGSGGSSQTGGATGGTSSSRGGSGGSGGSGGASTLVGSGGRTGSGGSIGSGGAPGSGGATVSTAPTACSFPSAWNPGSATYTTYSLPNAATACGYNGSNNTIKNIANGANFAAIPGQSSSNFDTSNRCGACVQIGSAIITIVDECPYDGSNNPPCKANPTGHLDLSNAAASAGGVKGDPNVHGQTQWKYVPCPVTGNVIVRLKPGNDNEMFIENGILPVASVTCGGQTGSRTSYGAWHFGSNVPGASCTVTDLANRTITLTAGSAQGQDVDTGKQFPKCL